MTAATVEQQVIWSEGDRVAVDCRSCDEPEFVGCIGTVVEIHPAEGEVTICFDDEPDELYDFDAGELCEAKGLMPGASDTMILSGLLGKVITTWRESTGTEKYFVKHGNERKPFYRVDRREDPALDQLHFVSEFGFTAVYLRDIRRVR